MKNAKEKQTEGKILAELASIKQMLQAQSTLTKDVLSFEEATTYLNLSASDLYKKTSARKISHFKPDGKKIYFNRIDLDQYKMRNRIKTAEEIQVEASQYLLNKG